MLYTGYYKFHKPGFLLQVLLTSVHFKLITESLVIWYFLEEDIWLLLDCFFTSYSIHNSDHQTWFNEPRVNMHLVCNSTMPCPTSVLPKANYPLVWTKVPQIQGLDIFTACESWHRMHIWYKSHTNKQIRAGWRDLRIQALKYKSGQSVICVIENNFCR